MDRFEIENQIAEFASAAAEMTGAELVHSELKGFGKNVSVRVFIEKDGGITHEDCSAVSIELESRLDAVDLIPGTYILEVSSPGIERGLYKKEDFVRFKGELAKLKTKRPLEGQRNFRGRISGFEDGIVLFDDKTSGTVRIPFESVAKANLEFDIERELRQAKKQKS